MSTFILPIILILSSVGLFFGFINPKYTDIVDLKKQSSEYEQALVNANKLILKRDELAQKYNQFTPDSIDKIQKMLPDSVDNIRLIIAIEQIANKYGMPLENPKYEAASITADKKASQPATPAEANEPVKDYDSFELGFTVTGTYENFLKFLDDIEKNLRIVDIKAVDFSPKEGSKAFKFEVTIDTYWLKS